MDPSTWLSVGALLVAIVALFFTGIAARAAAVQAKTAVEQTELQRKIQQDAAQPYVWVDIRPDTKTQQLFTLVVGNSGPTIATNVRAAFDPPLRVGTTDNFDEKVERLLSDGLPSLAPGRQIVWFLGTGTEVLKPNSNLRFTITVKADGPAGPVEELQYDVDAHAFAESLDSPDGSLHYVRTAIEKVAKAIEKKPR